MMKKYHLLTLEVSGKRANTIIEGSVANWVIKHEGKPIVVLNSLRITKQEYLNWVNRENKQKPSYSYFNHFVFLLVGMVSAYCIIMILKVIL